MEILRVIALIFAGFRQGLAAENLSFQSKKTHNITLKNIDLFKDPVLPFTLRDSIK